MSEASNMALRRPPGRRHALRGPSTGVSRQLVRSRRVSVLIPVFILLLALPVILFVGPLRLSPYRIFLIALFIPCVLAWLNGSMGRIRAPDLLVLASVLWTVMALSVHLSGPQAVEAGGIHLVEVLGSYLLARWLIRDPESFEAMARSLFWTIVILLPFAVFETLTARPILNEALGALFEVFPDEPMRPRWGFDRVQGPFQHPILFGVFCAAGFALSYYVLGYGRRGLRRLVRPAVVAVSVFLSLSSGPVSALAAQVGIIVWDRILRHWANRWTIFFVLAGMAYIVVDLLSNRTPIEVFISYTAFNPATAYGRINIWHYGSAEVWRHPLLGTGGPWEHPAWMTDSVDMFWLANALVAGIPAALAILLAPIVLVVMLGRASFADERLASYRTGLVVTIAALFLTGWAVHFWNAILCLFMFILGSGAWMLDLRQTGREASASPAKALNPGRARKRAMSTPVR